jgi:ArsR family transcriptional regulator, zinc-responsive transcriptional repressor
MAESISPARLAKVADYFGMLAAPVRLRIVEVLLEGRCTVGWIADVCGISQPLASHHLGLLRRGGLVTQECDGRHIYYRVAETGLKLVIACVRRFSEEAVQHG